MRGRGRKGPNPLTRSYESNGPDVKIRGTALHIAEKYVQLARDAQSSGDRVGRKTTSSTPSTITASSRRRRRRCPSPRTSRSRTTRDGDNDGEDGDDDGDMQQAWRQWPGP